VKKPRALFFRGLPAGHHARIVYSWFTAANEKIPLSVVQVNNKPQYLVFCSRSGHLLAKPRHLPVESVIGLVRRGFPSPALPQNLCTLGVAALFCPLSSLVDPAAGFKVQKQGNLGRNCGSCGQRAGKCRREEPRRPLLLKLRLARNHLLVQDAHNQDSGRYGDIEHNVFSTLKPA
jgi:hypothetical protein